MNVCLGDELQVCNDELVLQTSPVFGEIEDCLALSVRVDGRYFITAFAMGSEIVVSEYSCRHQA